MIVPAQMLFLGAERGRLRNATRARAHFLVAPRRREHARNLFHVTRQRGAWGRQLAAAALGLGEARGLVRRNSVEERHHAPGRYLGSNEEKRAREQEREKARIRKQDNTGFCRSTSSYINATRDVCRASAVKNWQHGQIKGCP